MSNTRLLKQAPQQALKQVFLGVFIWLAVCAFPPDLEVSGAQVAEELGPGDRLSGLVRAPARFSFPLNENSYVRLSLWFDSTLSVVLRGPQNESILGRELGPVEDVPLSFFGEAPGTYELVLSRRSDGPAIPGFTIEVHELRKRSEGDEKRVQVERSLLEADQLASEWTLEAMEEAIQIINSALTDLEPLNDKRLEARFLRSLGVLQFRLGENEKAITVLNRAISLGETSGYKLEEIYALNEMVRVCANLGQTDRGRELGDRCLRLSEQVNRTEAKAICQEAMGYITSYVSPQECIPFNSKALDLWRALENRRAEARILTELGHAYTAVSKERLSRECFEEGLRLQEEMGDPEQRAWAIQGLAAHLSKLDDKEGALDLFYKAQAIAERIYSPRLSGAVLNGLGMLFFDGKEERVAVGYFREALEAYELVGDAQSQGATLGLIGWAELALENPQAALEAFSEALPFFERLNDRRNQAILLQFMGETYSQMDRYNEAVDSFEEALIILQESGDHFSQFLTLFQLGLVHQESQQLEAALRYYSRALDLSLETGYRHREAQARFRLAQVQQGMKQLAEARRQAATAISVTESVRSDFPGEFRTSYLASVHSLFDLYIDVLEESHQEDQTAGYDSLAFQISEQARARSLLESLEVENVQIRQGVDPDLLEQEKDLRAALNRVAEQQIYLPADAVDEAETLRKEIGRLTAEYTQLDALIRSRSPQYAALTRPSILSLKDVQDQLLDKETLLLEYQLGEKKSFLWVVSKDSHSLHTLPPRVEIEKAVLELLRLVKAREPRRGESTRERRLRIREAERQYWIHAAALSDVLLGRMDTTSEHKRLVIVSDGVLQYVPFSALPIPGDGTDSNPGPLVMKYELVRLPSASILAALRKETTEKNSPARALAILADPVLQPDDPRLPNNTGAVGSTSQSRSSAPSLDSSRFPRLPSTQYEAEAIVGLLPKDSFFKATGFDANREVATSGFLRDFEIVHFATHSILDQEHPGLSGVVLSMFDRNGDPVEGFLRLHDIYNLDLPVDMVVLSACESYLGKEFRGEGLVGLVRGFMYAGADRVVASLWKVDDLATKELMVRFYRALIVDRKTAPAALRAAQNQMLETPEWRSPFYWAAFIVQGDWLARGEPARE